MAKPEPKLDNVWWVRRMREAEPRLRQQKAQRLRGMTPQESLEIFKALCGAGQLPPESERRRFEAARMKVAARIRRVLNQAGGHH